MVDPEKALSRNEVEIITRSILNTISKIEGKN